MINILVTIFPFLDGCSQETLLWFAAFSGAVVGSLLRFGQLYYSAYIYEWYTEQYNRKKEILAFIRKYNKLLKLLKEYLELLKNKPKF